MERDVYLVRRGLFSSGIAAPLHSLGTKLSNIDPSLAHWGMEVVDAYGRGTRFEALTEHGVMKLYHSPILPDSGYRKINWPYAGKGKTRLTDREIWDLGERIIAENPKYVATINDCQTIAAMLVDKTVEKNTLLGKLEAKSQSWVRKLA